MARNRDRKAAGEKSGGKSRALPLKKRTGPNIPVLLLALAGMALTAYLSFSFWSGAQPLYCGEGSSCDLVQTSRWGKFLGLPTSFWGFIVYSAIAYTAFRVRNPARHWKFIWTVALFGLAHSLYLTGISLWVIGAACAYCLFSLAIMAAIFILSTLQRPQGLPDFSWPSWAGQTVVVAALIVGGMHLNYSGVFDAAAGPEEPRLKALATHLTDSGAIFYGAFW